MSSYKPKYADNSIMPPDEFVAMSNDLLPCPFCGIDNASVYPVVDFAEVQCDTCGARSPMTEDEASAVAAWNSRAKWTLKEKERGDNE